MKKTLMYVLFLIMLAAVLTACGGETGQENDMNMDENMEENMGEQMDENMDGESGNMHMEHSSSGEVPEALQEAENPAFAPGSKVIIQEGHMEGMKGAEATISGAFDTTVYAVTYTPTGGGEPVENHKWVIHEELADPGEAPLEPGTEVTLKASHMEGMEGATATIDSAKETTVYMVDFIPTNSDLEVKNHKWVTEDELSPIE